MYQIETGNMNMVLFFHNSITEGFLLKSGLTETPTCIGGNVAKIFFAQFEGEQSKNTGKKKKKEKKEISSSKFSSAQGSRCTQGQHCHCPFDKMKEGREFIPAQHCCGLSAARTGTQGRTMYRMLAAKKNETKVLAQCFGPVSMNHCCCFFYPI